MSNEIAIVEINSEIEAEDVNIAQGRRAKNFFSALGIKVDWYTYGPGVELDFEEEIQDLIPHYEAVYIVSDKRVVKCCGDKKIVI